jgi:hypothetical protein
LRAYDRFGSGSDFDARSMVGQSGDPQLILLAMDDVSVDP